VGLCEPFRIREDSDERIMGDRHPGEAPCDRRRKSRKGTKSYATTKVSPCRQNSEVGRSRKEKASLIGTKMLDPQAGIDRKRSVGLGRPLVLKKKPLKGGGLGGIVWLPRGEKRTRVWGKKKNREPEKDRLETERLVAGVVCLRRKGLPGKNVSEEGTRQEDDLHRKEKCFPTAEALLGRGKEDGG